MATYIAFSHTYYQQGQTDRDVFARASTKEDAEQLALERIAELIPDSTDLVRDTLQKNLKVRSISAIRTWGIAGRCLLNECDHDHKD